MKRSSDFARLRREGQSRAGRFLVVSHMHDPSITKESPFLIGIITSRKVGMAVVRNRARRRIRALANDMAAQIAPGSMLVVIARYTISKADYGELRHDWNRLGSKMGIFTSLSA
jgi:ribonuclease P protein component